MYCNYSKDKYNSEITFIIPDWCKSLQEGITDYAIFEITPREVEFCNVLKYCENSYNGLISDGWKPQQARQVLPNALKTELVMTCYASDWKHFFSLRADKAAHPSAQELAYPLQEEFIKRNYI